MQAARRQLGARVANPRFHRRTIAQTETTILAVESGRSRLPRGQPRARRAGHKAPAKASLRDFLWTRPCHLLILPARLTRRDKEHFDGICDHLMVIDRSRRQWTASRPSVIGTYRLLRQEVAERHGGFYSAREFDIADLLNAMRASGFSSLAAHAFYLPTDPSAQSNCLARRVELCARAPNRRDDWLRKLRRNGSRA